MKQPVSTSEPRLGAVSSVYGDFKNLPEPQEYVVAAVYKFRDQTGQYKHSEIGTNWSTAVTQGATSILVKAMEESGWFIPIEREGLGNLLNERKIIRSSRAAFGAEGEESESMLPPLLFGGIILDGGIISYESNVLTGGAGLRYFGAGASGEYREDRVTIYLRAISTSDGRILKTVHTTKTILSQKVDAGLFRYVSLKKLLEAEIGFTFNEPAGIAVQEAIDKAVYSLIIEGIIDELWTVKDENDLQSAAIMNYIEEKEMNDRTDFLGFESLPKRAPLKLGLSPGGMVYDGDYPNPSIGPMLQVDLGFFQNSALSFNWTLGAGQLATRDYFSSIVQFTELKAKYRFFNSYSTSPYLQLGGGYMLSTGNQPFDYSLNLANGSFGYLGGDLGFEYMANDRFGIDLSLGYNWLLSDLIDNMEQGKYNDFFWTIKLGFNFYLGK